MFLFAKMATIFALGASRYGRATKQALANTANHHLLLLPRLSEASTYAAP